MMARKAKYFVGIWRRCATIRTFFNLAKRFTYEKMVIHYRMRIDYFSLCE